MIRIIKNLVILTSIVLCDASKGRGPFRLGGGRGQEVKIAEHSLEIELYSESKDSRVENPQILVEFICIKSRLFPQRNGRIKDIESVYSKCDPAKIAKLKDFL